MNKTESSVNSEARKGWKQMKELLDKEMPVEKKNRRRYIFLLLFLLLGSAGIFYWSNHNGNGSSELASERQKSPEQTTVNGRKQLHDNSVPASQVNISYGQASKQLPARVQSTPAHDNNTAGVVDVQENTQQPSARSQKDALAANSGVGKMSTAKANKLSRNVSVNRAEAENQPAMAAKSDSRLAPATERKDVNAKPAISPAATQMAIASNDVSVSSVAQSTHADTIRKSASATQPPAVAQQAPEKKIPVAKRRRSRLNYGLEWSLPLPFNNNALFVEADAKKYPLTVLIPALWFSGSLSNRSSLYFTANPFAQYLLSRQSALQKDNYSLSAVSASNINQPRDVVNLAQVFSVYKVRGFDVGLQYAYQLSQSFSVSCGIASTLTTSAVFNERIVRNATDVVKDSLYGVVKADKAWAHMKAAFATGRLSMFYSFNKFEAGAMLSKPFSSVYKSDLEENLPLNVQVFLRWKIKEK